MGYFSGDEFFKVLDTGISARFFNTDESWRLFNTDESSLIIDISYEISFASESIIFFVIFLVKLILIGFRDMALFVTFFRFAAMIKFYSEYC
jgi:hypothetical protein